jgi:hypothetical protein
VRMNGQGKTKRLTSWFLLTAFLFSFSPGTAMAGEGENGAGGDGSVPAVAADGVRLFGRGELVPLVDYGTVKVPPDGVSDGKGSPTNTKVSLEEAVKIVKGVFVIPQEFTKFTSGYSQEENKQVWQLSWNAEKEPHGSLNARVDGETGEILEMNLWQASPGRKPQGRLPALSRAEAVQKAEQLVKQLQPQRWSQLKLEEMQGELLPLMSWSGTNYQIKWVRQVQGVPFPQDGVTVQVDSQSGTIMGYSFRWTDAEFPDASKAIASEKARQIWKEGMLELQYFRAYSADPAKPKPVQLVYRLTHPSEGVIDALTGKPLEKAYTIFRDEGMEVKVLLSKEVERGVELTPQELDEVMKAGKVIPQEKAEAVVRQWVTIPAHVSLEGVHLSREDWRAPGARTWNFSWRYTGEKELAEDAIRWISAAVDAESGILLSFSIDKTGVRPDQSDSSRKQQLSVAEAQKKAEAFLSKIQPQLFQQVKLVKKPTSDVRPLEKTIVLPPDLPSQSFEYQRLVNGVVYPDNGMTVSVDLHTGDIQSYRFKWSALAFPSLEGILEREAVADYYLARQPLTLQYVQENWAADAGARKEIKLVYAPLPAAGQQAEAMTDARTGAPLDSQGENLSKQPQPYQFSDIAGHWAEKEIALLGQAGLFGEYGVQFHPNEPVKIVQLLRAMLALERGATGVASLSDEEVMEQAKQQGWLKEDLKAEAQINRLQLSCLVIRFLGLESAAQIEGIYQAPFKDFKKTPPAEQGYVALSWGLGILRGEQGSFGGAQTVSRAQAAVALVRMLKVEIK